MKFTATVDLKIDTAGLLKAVASAARGGMRDVVVEVAAETVTNSPVETGNNRRSIAAEVSGMGVVAGEGGERIVDENKIEGAVY